MRAPFANKQAASEFEAGFRRRQELFERVGHPGPYTPSELLAFGDLIEPLKEPDPDPPDWVVAAMEAEDLASIAFDTAHRAWSEAYLARLRTRGPVIIPDGQPVFFDRDGRPFTGTEDWDLVQAEDRAAQRRGLASERLRKARAASRQAQASWREQLRIERT
jgi:hypothetical protein